MDYFLYLCNVKLTDTQIVPRETPKYKQNPKSRKGIKKMTNQVSKNEVVSELTDIVNRIRNMALNEVIEVLDERRNKLERILNNGREYWSQATGERFDRINKSRRKVWNKVFMYNDMIGIICNMR
jgi:hypothetical protein